MPYFEDKYGYYHYHEPPGTEEQWLERDESGYIDPQLAQIKKEDVTTAFLEKLSDTQRVQTKTGAVWGEDPADVTTAPTPLLPSPAPVTTEPEDFPLGGPFVPSADPTGSPVDLQPISYTQGVSDMITSNGYATTLPYSPAPATQTGIVESIGNIGQMLPLMLLMQGGRRNNMSQMLMMMMLFGGLSGGTGMQVFGGTQTPMTVQNIMMWSLLPKMGSLATFMLGGLAGTVGQAMKPRVNRRRTRIIYRGRAYTRRR